MCAALVPPAAAAAELRPEATLGYEQYILLSEMRMRGELLPGGVFLWVDRLPEPRRSDAHARLERGEIISERLETPDPSGRSATPGALIHHWVGTVFISGVSLAQVLAVVQDYDRHSEYYKPDVMQSKKVAQNGDEFKVHYRLRKKKIVTIILDADYDVHRYFLSATQAYSNSVAVRVAQVENAGQPDEHELPPGKDGGYMWRLNSYWRYFDTGHGVYVQCEAISLTRDVPAGLNWLVGSFVQSVPRESLDFTLRSTRNAVLRVGSPAAH
ncbi:MAG TPA: hypothetical protein VH161_02810 [Candidatus Acidoferrales bacterium]|nr:hypothetical protein [Candidatus Acidoferrales bacterium]